MNSKVARAGFVQSSKDCEDSRDRMFENISGGLMKTAKKEEKKKEKDEKKKDEKCVTKESQFADKMTKQQADDSGFFKAAKSCGWGIYQISDLDGGQGSIWYLQKGANGDDYLVKQMDNAGEVVRRVKTAMVEQSA